MRVGILKEIKPQENRVCMTPSGVEKMKRYGHEVYVEKNAGKGSGFEDINYIEAGAKIFDTPAKIFDVSDMVMHVKEPQPSEYSMIKRDQIVFTYLHLAADKNLTEELMKTGSIGIAYETVETEFGFLPLLAPMSEVAGRLATQEGAKYLERTFGGRGVLLGGVPGTPPAKVVVIGGGVVGYHSAIIACGMGADVTILDMDLARVRYLSEIMPANCKTLMSSQTLLKELAKDADLVIGAVLVAGTKTPKLISRQMLSIMKKGAVIVDVAIDQGGCFENSKPTTHEEPIFEIDGIIHYCVANMPGAVPLTSTIALTNSTLPYTVELANKGWKEACKSNLEFQKGINYYGNKLTYKPVADTFGFKYTPVTQIL